MSMRKRRNNPKKRWLILIAVIVVVVVSVTAVTLAFFTDEANTSTATKSGTLYLSPLILQVQDVSTESGGTGLFGSSISNWNPGDVNTVNWNIGNLGNKSVDLRYILELFWLEDLPELGTLYLYPANMSDNDIKVDLDSGSPNKFIAIGDDKNNINYNSATYNGYRFILNGDTLDGTGDNAETGEATERTYFKTTVDFDTADTLEDTLTAAKKATYDYVEFKLVFPSYPYTIYMGKQAIFQVTAQAKQHRNTADDWSIIDIQAVN